MKFWILGVLQLQESFDSCITTTLTLCRSKNSPGSNDSHLHVVELSRGRSFIWQIGVNSSIQDRRFFIEPLTTGPHYDPLLLLLARPVMCTRTQDRQGTPARSASRTSLAKVPATCVQDARIGYIQDVPIFKTLRIIIEPMAGSVPPVGRHHSHAHLHHRLVLHTRPPYQTRLSTYYSGTPMASATNRRN